MLVIAYNNLPSEKYELIKMPEYKNFDPEYMKWLIQGSFAEESLIEFRKPYGILNTVISTPLSITKVHQPYLDENVSAKQKKQFFMDCNGMNDELIKYVIA